MIAEFRLFVQLPTASPIAPRREQDPVVQAGPNAWRNSRRANSPLRGPCRRKLPRALSIECPPGRYALFDYAEEPDYSTLRYLGNRIMELMGKQDQSWIIDQIIEIEAPEAVKNVLKGLRDTLVVDSIAF
jgi:hypothetical protein